MQYTIVLYSYLIIFVIAYIIGNLDVDMRDILFFFGKCVVEVYKLDAH